ncbi:putative bacteriocin export ABC transporter [Sporosarcina sp. FSL K6-5500]|uniref:putative bacteriocin export ABC transporter n=1 Tax=Sporosarcina sp. FSL K6-5500 TaxID=2921558 RepID=UPI0030F69C05
MIELINISKKFHGRTIFEEYNLKIKKGDFISIVGESGTGKTTLLNIIGLLERPDSGDLIVDGKSNLTKKQILLLQRNSFGYLFQNYALIDNETVEKNLLIALAYRKNINKKEEIKNALKAVNLSNYENRKVYELSGGEQQRIALARVILKKCDYILADEPTGNLDKNNSTVIFDVLKTLNREGKTIVFVTHDLELANRATTRIEL